MLTSSPVLFVWGDLSCIWVEFIAYVKAKTPSSEELGVLTFNTLTLKTDCSRILRKPLRKPLKTDWSKILRKSLPMNFLDELTTSHSPTC